MKVQGYLRQLGPYHLDDGNGCCMQWDLHYRLVCNHWLDSASLLLLPFLSKLNVFNCVQTKGTND